MKSERIEAVLPKLRDYDLKSPETDLYNCIAWSLYDTKRWWWPTLRYGCYWPPGFSRDNKRETVVAIFELSGYQKCDSENAEIGYEKVAIYEIVGEGVQHVARQLQTGEWTSKLGEWEDITHKTAKEVESADYGEVVQFLKRHRKEWDDREGTNREHKEQQANLAVSAQAGRGNSSGADDPASAFGKEAEE